jgi:hypothetical protein
MPEEHHIEPDDDVVELYFDCDTLAPAISSWLERGHFHLVYQNLTDLDDAFIAPCPTACTVHGITNATESIMEDGYRDMIIPLSADVVQAVQGADNLVIRMTEDLCELCVDKPKLLH